MGDLPRQLDPPHVVIPITPCTMAWGFLEADVSLSLPSQTGPCLDLFLSCDFWGGWRSWRRPCLPIQGRCWVSTGALFSAVIHSGGGGRMEVELLWASTLERALSVLGVCWERRAAQRHSYGHFTEVLYCPFMFGGAPFRTSGANNLINSQHLPNIHSFNPHSNFPTLAIICLPFDR